MDRAFCLHGYANLVASAFDMQECVHVWTRGSLLRSFDCQTMQTLQTIRTFLAERYKRCERSKTNDMNATNERYERSR